MNAGMSCGFGLHDEVEAELQGKFPLREESTTCHLAYDGLLLEGFQIQ